MIQPKPSVRDMKPYDPPLEDRTDYLRLDFNENTIGCSPKVIEALRKVTAEKIAMYPEYENFKKKLAGYARIDKENLFISNASDEAIMAIMQVFLEKDDEIIIPEPTFPMFRFYAEVAGAKIKDILYNDDLSFPTDKVLASITKKTKIVVLVNPNNPTGTSIEKDDIIKIIEKNKDTLIILDEAYVEYSKESCLGLIGTYDNLIILRTFSKAFGLAGLRLGYAIADKNIISSLDKASSPYSINSLAIIGADAALDDIRYMEDYADEVIKARELLYKELKSLDIETYPSKANFIVAKFGKDAPKIQKRLKEKQILVRDRSNLALMQGTIRLGVGNIKQTKKLIKALKEII